MSKPPKKSSKKPSPAKPNPVEVLSPTNAGTHARPVLRHTSFTHSWSAPFLPPEIMKKYDEVAPNGAARLFQIFEEETKHRREMERLSLNYQGRDLLVGKRYALVFVLAVLGVIMFAIANDAPWVAAALGAGMLGTIALGFFRVFGDGVAKKQNGGETKKPSD